MKAQTQPPLYDQLTLFGPAPRPHLPAPALQLDLLDAQASEVTIATADLIERHRYVAPF